MNPTRATLNRRQLLAAGAASFVFPIGAKSQKSEKQDSRSSQGHLCLGLGGMAYFTGFCRFLNWAKTSAPRHLKLQNRTDLSAEEAFAKGYFDVETGELVNPCPAELSQLVILFYALPGAGSIAGGYDYSGMQWRIEWKGTSQCRVFGLTTGGTQSIDNNKGHGAFVFGKNPVNTWISWKILDPHDPPRDIKIYQAHYASNVARGEIFNPDWLAQIRDFGVFRFMDWQVTNGSEMTEFAQIAREENCRWGAEFAPRNGPKGGVPVSIICQLGNLTGSRLHVNIPHRATDSFVKTFAEYFRDHLDPGVGVTFEYSNECWNFGFRQTRYCYDQGKKLFGTDDSGNMWYGYRAAQCMKIIRDTFNDRARWRGCLATQTVNTGCSNGIIKGVKYFLNEAGREQQLKVTDLFNDLAVTGYFGDVQRGRRIENISNTNPAIATVPRHRWSNGQRLKINVATGMVELNDQFVTIANVTKDGFELSGVDTRNFSRFQVSDRNYAHPALVFDLMDKSTELFQKDSGQYPNKFAYFNRVVAESCLTGSSDGFITEVSVASLRDKFWPAQKAIADANGLDLTQYEGGLHFVGDTYLAGYGGERQFDEYLFNFGYCKEIGDVYTAMYEAFFKVGGVYPAKFVDAGGASQYGVWGGMRYIPGDDKNPVWTAVRKANGG